MNPKNISLILIISLIVLFSLAVLLFVKDKSIVINNFEDCVNAGYPLMESYPMRCKTPDGRTFTDEICSISTGESLTLSEAKEIARFGECGDEFKESYVCNSNTGTWWIDLDIVKEGCSPACVVNVSTKQAEINWRCTGLIQE